MCPTAGSRDERTRSDPDSTVKSWLLLTGSRTAVAVAIAVAVFAFVFAVTVSGLAPLRSHRATLYVFSGLITGNLTIITVVVSINQLLLSRELRTPPQLESEIDGMVDYRQDIEDAAARIAPVEPLGFLRLLFETTRQRAQRLGGLSANEADEDLAADVDRVVTEITRSADRVDALLQTSDVGTFQVLSTTLNTNYARDINQLRRIKSTHADRMPDHVADAVDGLVELLQQIDIARQYLKSVYLQQELAKLSRLLFYTGLPSVVVVTAALLTFTAPNGPALPQSLVEPLVSAVITVGLVPLAVLASFILRSATVAERTAAIIPFTTPAQEE